MLKVDVENRCVVETDSLMQPNTSPCTRKQQYAHHLNALRVRTIVLLGSTHRVSSNLEVYEA